MPREYVRRGRRNGKPTVGLTPDRESPEIVRGVQVTENRAVRAERVPLGTPRLKLKVHDDDPNVVRRWINDKGGRLQEAQEGGWRFVERKLAIGTPDVVPGNTDTGARVSKVVGVRSGDEGGGALRAYLMEIDRELYDADQEEKEAATVMRETAIRSGSPDGVTDGRFIPQQGIRLRS